MTAKELIEQLSKVEPETEIVGGMFNGRVETYTVLDRHFIWRLKKVLRQHRSREWKKEQIYRLLTEF